MQVLNLFSTLPVLIRDRFGFGYRNVSLIIKFENGEGGPGSRVRYSVRVPGTEQLGVGISILSTVPGTGTGTVIIILYYFKYSRALDFVPVRVPVPSTGARVPCLYKYPGTGTRYQVLASGARVRVPGTRCSPAARGSPDRLCGMFKVPLQK